MNLRLSRKGAYRFIFFAGVGALVLFVVLRAFAPPLWQVTPADLRAAQREVAVPGGDEKAPAVSGDFVAGEGIIEPIDRESRISAALDGRVAAVEVKEGDHVEQGAILVVLDNQVEKAALAVAEADVASSRAQLARTAAGQRRQEVEASIADAEAARARAELSADSLARTTKLHQTGTITQDALERAQRQAEIDAKAYASADARSRAAVAGARRDDVAIDAARLQAAMARREQARATYERTRVRAPIAGEVLEVKIRAGERFSAASHEPLVVLGDTRKLQARVDVNERDVARVKVGQAAFVQLPAFGPKRFAGRVVEVGRRMGRKNVRSDDPTERIDTKILEVVCELDEPTGLVPGLRVTGFIDPSSDVKPKQEKKE
jgi:HlyD family secretion protein